MFFNIILFLEFSLKADKHSVNEFQHKFCAQNQSERNPYLMGNSVRQENEIRFAFSYRLTEL